LFKKAGKIGQAANCFEKQGEFATAAKLYEEVGLVGKAIECYEQGCDWEMLLHCLSRNKGAFKEEEKEALINRYVPVALNSLYRQFAEEGLDEENRGKLQEMKIRMKYQKNVAVIEEDEELLSDEEEDQMEYDEEKEEEEEKRVDEEGEQYLIDASEGEEEPEVVEEVEKEEKKKEEEGEVAQLDDFEHLSQYDPDDEFLQSSRSFSVIESILSRKSVSKTSEFSLVSKGPASVISMGQKTSVIESKRDLYAEDIVTQKIIYLVSLFSDEVQGHL